MNLTEIGCEDVDWINLSQDWVHWWTLCKCGNEPLGSIQDREFLDQLSDY